MTLDVVRPEAAPATAAIRPRNLLLTLAELAPLLEESARRGDRLNAFLLAAGMSQIADDYAHRDPARLAEGAAYLEAKGRTGLARVAAGAASGAQSLREKKAAPRSLAVFRGELQRIVEATARALAGQGELGVAQLPAVPPELKLELLRLPACFHAFDQRPEDVERLADELARRRPDRARTLFVVGVRTSGSYLAPLCAAFLRRHGYADVRVLTVRPGRPLDAAERRQVRACAASDGLALVIDDAPGTGRSLSTATRALERLGVRRESIVVVAPLFAGQELPPLISAYDSVVLPSGEWEIERRLETQDVAESLEQLFGRHVEDVLPVPLPERAGRRGHRRALFRVQVAGDGDRMVLAEGVGLGYFGEHALAVAEELGSRLPETYGLSDGVLYREWLPEEQRRADGALAPAVAEYVAARAAAFPVGADLSARLAGQVPAWEVVSGILSRAFLRAWPLARLAFLDRAVQLLLRPSRPSVVDGHTCRSEWFATGRGPSGFSKVGFAHRSFWHLGLTCFDPVFDLAGVDPGGLDDRLARDVRRAYDQLSGEPVDAERWLLYQLAHLWGRRRTHAEEEPALRRAAARALQRYFAEVLLADTAPSPDGPLCAIDLDGVLETEALGVPATTAAGALALRALARHGFRPVIVSGRSSAEVKERCVCYRLAGGVAEYGAVAHNAEHARERALLPDGALRRLDQLRAAVAEEDGVEIDADYEHSVRAYRRGRRGRRCGLSEESIARAVREVPVRAIRGEGQTDFVTVEIDKGTGLRALVEELGSDVALAVGDTASDLPMFALAQRALAPASADRRVRSSGIELVRRSYQAGLAEAVGRLLGHSPGACPVCRPPALPPRTNLVLELLSMQESGLAGVVANLPGLAWKVRTW
jgi:hydroxymethylpyrimidine pyrophosphatase-like HAD family hydrolase